MVVTAPAGVVMSLLALRLSMKMKPGPPCGVTMFDCSSALLQKVLLGLLKSGLHCCGVLRCSVPWLLAAKAGVAAAARTGNASAHVIKERFKGLPPWTVRSDM